MSEEKIYCGSGKERTFDSGGSVINISLCVSDIPKKYIKESNNGKKYVNLKLGARREEGKYGETHHLSVDTWMPKKQNETPKQEEEDDCPF